VYIFVFAAFWRNKVEYVALSENLMENRPTFSTGCSIFATVVNFLDEGKAR